MHAHAVVVNVQDESDYILDAYPLCHHRRWAKQKLLSFILILS